ALKHQAVPEREQTAVDLVGSRFGAAPRALRAADEIQRRPLAVDEQENAVDVGRVAVDDVARRAPGSFGRRCEWRFIHGFTRGWRRPAAPRKPRAPPRPAGASAP